MGEFIIGLDLGQSVDFSALSVLEKIVEKTLSPRGDKVKRETICHLRHLQRLPLGTPYPVIVESVIRLISKKEFGHKPTRVIDATGIGGAMYDMFTLEKR